MGRILLAVLFAAALCAFVWWTLSKHSSVPVVPPARLENKDAAQLSRVESSPTQPQHQSVTNFPTPLDTPSPLDSSPGSFVGQMNLIIPVSGVRPQQLIDTFTDARSEERVHDAIDIPAPVGTPVLAAADGRVIKLFHSEKGGTTIYQLSKDEKVVFYYAHLQRYADGITEGKPVRQGEVLAYVGDTGNAGAGNYHLHFSISIVADPSRYWEGTNINPFPLLRH